MRKKLALVLFMLFAFGLTVESLEAICVDEATCCVCLCQAPSLQPPVVEHKHFVRTAYFIAATHALSVQQLFDKSVYHPPALHA